MIPTIEQLEEAFKMMQIGFQKAGFTFEESVKMSTEALKNGDFESMVRMAVSLT